MIFEVTTRIGRCKLIDRETEGEERIWFNIPDIVEYIDDIDPALFDNFAKTEYLTFVEEEDAAYCTEEVIYTMLYASENTEVAEALYNFIYGDVIPERIAEFPNLSEYIITDASFYKTAS